MGQRLGEKEIISSLGLNASRAADTRKCGNLPVRISGAEEERTGCRRYCRQGNHRQEKTESEAHVNLLAWAYPLNQQAGGGAEIVFWSDVVDRRSCLGPHDGR